ncbi:hypothetical protein DLR69_15535 [Vibrio paracholerae]|uniref:Glycosyltransferase 2-like domain-containing protein n=1 Tax=Vibrio paracholerae TaxID=650003 RepID=A0ABX9FI74_9VIBR|nr:MULTISPECIES: glycosyltransferase [Vibrio]MBY3673517.1 glycosyltransferase family 2 protein [Vibrio cholerae]RBM51659.1 hypothetical protein DLR69_15535 [Vibrio paracholerae]
MKVNIVTVNFNSSLETIKMLESLEDSFSFIDSVIVVDNASDEFHVQTLVDYQNSYVSGKLNVSFEYLNKNIGYFPGLNYGISQLDHSRKHSDYTIVCNNDLLFEHKFFEALENSVYPLNVLALSPSVKTINAVYQNPSMRSKPSKLRTLFYQIYYSNYTLGRIVLKLWRSMGFGIDSNFKKDEEAKSIFIGIGAIYILTPKFFSYFEQLDYPLFLYGEEAFFSKQIYGAGGSIWYEPTMEVLHLESVSTDKLPSKFNYELNAKAFKLYKNYYRD